MNIVPHYVTESGRHFSTAEEAQDCERVEELARLLEPVLGPHLFADGYVGATRKYHGLDIPVSQENRRLDLEQILAEITKRYTLTPIVPPLP